MEAILYAFHLSGHYLAQYERFLATSIPREFVFPWCLSAHQQVGRDIVLEILGSATYSKILLPVLFILLRILP